MVVYGVQDTMKLIESGAVGKIICFEDLDYMRIKLRNPTLVVSHSLQRLWMSN